MTIALSAIEAEVLRSRLETVVEEAAVAIQHTSISPVVTDSLDFSASLLDAEGRLVSGGGFQQGHWYVAADAVRATIARYGDTVRDGDVFIANDPHRGGGFHPADVVVQQPIFAEGRVVGWAALSSHMPDIGGMQAGTFPLAATECYQEGLRLPPVRLFDAGEENSAVWDIFLNNVRRAKDCEMDLRGLVAGCHVARERAQELATTLGADPFEQGMRDLIALTEQELRRRIGTIEDGTYQVTSWVEWAGELYAVPCRLTKVESTLDFDYEGAPPQAPHFFNSKPYIVTSGIGVALWTMVAWDLPINDGLYRPITVRCPEGSILHSTPPAPISMAHVNAAFVAHQTAAECVRLALAASPQAEGHDRLTAWSADTSTAQTMWAYPTADGGTRAFSRLEGNIMGSSAADDRDGLDLSKSLLGTANILGLTDVEVWEDRDPILIEQRRHRFGAYGSGRHRAGAACESSFRLHGIDRAVGQAYGTRYAIPIPGFAGGRPGARVDYRVYRADGAEEPVGDKQMGVDLGPGDRFMVRAATGGGFGDPLDRDPSDVLHDVDDGRCSPQQAAETFGVVVSSGKVDHEATDAMRDEVRRARLARSTPPARPVATSDTTVDRTGATPWFPGVVQVGDFAVAERSGAVLAVAPGRWTEGCPTLVEALPAVAGPPIVTRTYLDPLTGTALHVEVCPEDAPTTFDSRPDRWTTRADGGRMSR